jgi:hypothetical protein
VTHYGTDSCVLTQPLALDTYFALHILNVCFLSFFVFLSNSHSFQKLISADFNDLKLIPNLPIYDFMSLRVVQRSG